MKGVFHLSTASNLLTSDELLAFSVAMSDEQNGAEDRAVGYGRDGCHFSGVRKWATRNNYAKTALLCALWPHAHR